MLDRPKNSLSGNQVGGSPFLGGGGGGGGESGKEWEMRKEGLTDVLYLIDEFCGKNVSGEPGLFCKHC